MSNFPVSEQNYFPRRRKQKTILLNFVQQILFNFSERFPKKNNALDCPPPIHVKLLAKSRFKPCLWHGFLRKTCLNLNVDLVSSYNDKDTVEWRPVGIRLAGAQNTYHRGNYHSMDGLQLNWNGFVQTWKYAVIGMYWNYWIQISNTVIQWYFPLQCVFSGLAGVRVSEHWWSYNSHLLTL